MDKWIWLIGGSIMSEPMCQEIKSRGYKLFLTDGNGMCHCKSFADFFIIANVYDVALNIGLTSTINFKPAAVLTIGTDAGPTVSALSAHYGLTGIPQTTAEAVKNKAAMRRLLGECKAPVWDVKLDLQDENPDETILEWESLADSANIDAYPVVIKSLNESGSRGLSVVWERAHFAEALAGRQAAIFEEYLWGKNIYPEWRNKYGFDTSEAAFDFFAEDGKVHFANGALRMFWVNRPGIEAGHINPFEANDEIMALAQDAAEKLGVTWGPFKLDMKHTKKYGWCVLEAATRLSGGFDHMVTSPLATGRDVTGVMLDVSLDGKVDLDFLANTKQRFACAYAPVFKPGKIDDFMPLDDGSEDIEGLKQLSETINEIIVLEDREIRELTCNQDRPLFVITEGGDPDLALGKAIEAAQEITPNYV